MLTLHPGFVLCCVMITRVRSHVRIHHLDNLADVRTFDDRSKVENGRTKLSMIMLGQIVHTLFISNFILCSLACACGCTCTHHNGYTILKFCDSWEEVIA